MHKPGLLEVVHSERFSREWERLAGHLPRAAEALAGFEAVVSRVPDLGMAVAGRSDCFGRPVHLDGASFLIVYIRQRRRLVLLSVRAVPGAAF